MNSFPNPLRIIARTANKRWLLVFPLFLAASGCNAPVESAASDTETKVAAGSTPGDTINTPQKPVNSGSKMSSDAGAGKEKPAAKTNAPKSDPKYKVVAEAQPGMPAEAVTALDKVKVPPPPADMTAPKKARVRLMTSKGPITVELNGVAAPLHVKSFLYLAKRGFYDATVLHRYEPGFVIQGGDPLTKNPALKEYSGMGGPGYQVPRERNSLKHDKFVFAAARSSDPNSAGSQFYITLEAAPNLDEGDGYTVYGKVVDGQATVLKLRAGDKLNKVVLVPEAKKN